MNGRLVVLYRFAEALGESVSIDSFDDRKRFQKAVYLGQAAGVDLGYRYSWYLKGPYSTALTSDYYALSDALEDGDSPSRKLVPKLENKLSALRDMLEPPKNTGLERSDWMELLASWHYLRTVSKLDKSAAEDTMRKQKPHLAQYISTAHNALKEHKLL